MDGTDIKLLREKLGLTQEQMAHRVGVSFKTVNQWERGKSKPSPLAVKVLMRMAHTVSKEGTDNHA